MNRTRLGKEADLVKEGMLESDKKWEALVSTLKEEHAKEVEEMEESHRMSIRVMQEDNFELLKEVTEKGRIEWLKFFLLQIAATIIGVLSVYVIVNLS